MRFADTLKALRAERGWSQGELADRAGLTRDGVAHLEMGRRSPSWETACQIADALGIGVEIFRSGEKRADSPPSTAEPKKRGRPRKSDDAGK